MPKNRFMYAGILLIAASAVLWVAAQILKRVEYALFTVAIIGVILVIVGMVLEAREGKEALKPADTPGEPLITMPEPIPAAPAAPVEMPTVDTPERESYSPSDPINPDEPH